MEEEEEKEEEKEEKEGKGKGKEEDHMKCPFVSHNNLKTLSQNGK